MAETSSEEARGAVENISSGSLSLKEEKFERPSSPDINCSICLEELRNKSFTDSCMHHFCFSCLLQWSKIKPECPLCKQRFRSIYYNIKPSGLYDIMEINSTPVIAPGADIEPTVLINLAFDRPRFRYRSTTLSRAMLYIGNVLGSYRPSSGRTMASDFRRRRQLGTSEFRRNIYRQGLWVRRNPEGRVRECSPEFYRLNPAQTHRLVPWLNRELNVLLDLSLDSHTISMEILSLITLYPILSSQFNRSLRRYLGVRTAHFIHEFYSFATSPYDMLAYDIHAEYSSVGNMTEPNQYDVSNRRGTPEEDEDSDIEVVVESPRQAAPDALINIPVDLSMMPGPSRNFSSQNGNSGAMLGTEDSPIVISDCDDESSISSIALPPPPIPDEGGNMSDSSVEFLTALPPPHLRTPEIITLCSDDETILQVSEVEDIIDEPVQEYASLPSPIPPSFSASNSVILEAEDRPCATRRKRRRSDRSTSVRYSFSSSEESDRKVKRRKSSRSKSKSSKKLRKRRDSTPNSPKLKVKTNRKQRSKNDYASSDSDYEPTVSGRSYQMYLKNKRAELAKLPPRLRLKSVVKVVNSDSSEIAQMEPGLSGPSRRRSMIKKYYSSSNSDQDYTPCCSRRVKSQVCYYNESSGLSNSENDYY